MRIPQKKLCLAARAHKALVKKEERMWREDVWEDVQEDVQEGERGFPSPERLQSFDLLTLLELVASLELALVRCGHTLMPWSLPKCLLPSQTVAEVMDVSGVPVGKHSNGKSTISIEYGDEIHYLHRIWCTISIEYGVRIWWCMLCWKFIATGVTCAKACPSLVHGLGLTWQLCLGLRKSAMWNCAMNIFKQNSLFLKEIEICKNPNCI